MLALIAAATLLAPALLTPTLLLAQTPGTLTGVVRDDHGRQLNGATVQVVGTTLSAMTDLVGRYRITGVPAGRHTLAVRSLGYQEGEIQVTITAGQIVVQDMSIEANPIALEGLVITGQVGQAEAFNRQRTAPSIKNVVSSEHIERFPDANVPGALRRIPGIAAKSDRGEPGAIFVRGLSPSLTTVTINGQRMPATGSDRGSSLTGISPEMLESLEVTKAITPDMDADAVAGSIDLRTRTPTQRQIDGRIEGGLHSLAEGGNGRAALFYGDRFDRFGLVIGADYSKQNRETENVQTNWTTWEGQRVLDRLTVQAYPMERTRMSLNSTLNYELAPGSQLYVRGMAARYETQEVRHTLAYRLTGNRLSATEIEGGRFDREGRNTFNEQHTYNLAAGGVHRLSSLNLDYGLAAGWANGNQPYRDYFTYRKTGVNLIGDASRDHYFPEVSVTNGVDPLDPAGFRMDKYEERHNLRSDKNFSGNVNLELPFVLGIGTGSVKFGGKYTTRTKENDEDLVEYYPVGTTFYMDQVGATDGFYRRKISRGKYSLGRVVHFDRGYSFAEANRDRLQDDINNTRLDNDSNDYTAKEAVGAGYLMASLNLGRLSLLGGLRYEHTDNDYTGKRLVYDADGNYVATEPTAAGSSYGNFFPNLHIRYALGEATNIRAAYTGAISRPSFSEIAPNEQITNESLRINRGNPDLRASRSQNLDLLAEHYFSSIGILSAGVFYKKFSDFIFRSTSQIVVGEYDGYDLVRPENGAEATVYGFEVGWHQQLDFLPGYLNGLGILANYTYTGSKTELGNAFDRPDTRFPDQVPHFANAALSYDRGGFSGLVSLNYQSSFMFRIGETAELDRYTFKRAQFDMAFSQQLSRRLRAFAELNNLTNEPYLTYTGTRATPIESEYEGRWGTFGVRFEF